jgi:hypothetical protein
VLLAAKLGAPIDRGVRAVEAVGCEGYRFLVTSAAGLEVVQVAT